MQNKFMFMGFVEDIQKVFSAIRRSRALGIVHIALLSTAMLALTLSFTIYDVFFLRREAVESPEEIHRISFQIPNVGWRSFLSKNALDAIARTSVVAGTAGFQDLNDLAIVDSAGTAQVRAQATTPDFFQVLGVKLFAGRALLASDDGNADEVPVVLSYRFWRQRYLGDMAVVGRSATLRNVPIRIVGISERAFQGFSLDSSADLRFPGAALPRFYPAINGRLPEYLYSYNHVLRLKPGVQPERARPEILAAYFAGEEEAWRQRPDFNPSYWEQQRNTTFVLEPAAVGESSFRDRNSQTLSALLAAATLMLLLVTSNLGGLWLSRAIRRQAEIAVRMAMGASLVRLFREMILEALALGTATAGIVLGLTYAVSPFIPRLLPPVRDFGWGSLQPIAADFTPNLEVLGLAILGCFLATGILVFSPGLALMQVNPIQALKRVRTSKSWKGQQAFLVLQVALSTAIVVGALLSAATLRNLLGVNLGYSVDSVATFDVKPVVAGYSGTESYELAYRTAERVRALPGVHRVAFGNGLLDGIGMVTTVYPTGQTITTNGRFNTSALQVSPEFFATIGQRLLAGREFTPQDAQPSKVEPVIVNDLYAKRYFGQASPIGRTIGYTALEQPAGAEMVIVGVVADAQFRSLRHEKPPIIYSVWNRPNEESAQNLGIAWKMYVSTGGGQTPGVHPSSLFEPVRQILRELAPNVPVTETMTLREQRDISLWTDALATAMAGGLALLAFVVAGLGIFSLLAQMVAARTKEIGIRMAVGAHAARVVSLIVNQIVWVVAGGFLLGGAAALMILPRANELFVGVSVQDPRVIALALLLVGAMAALASAVPAWRASCLQPTIALRED